MQTSLKILRKWPKPWHLSTLKRYCQDSSSEDPEKEKEKKKDGKKFEEETKKREAVKQSLNELLQSFNKGSLVTEEKVKIFHPQPKVTEKEPEIEDSEKEKEKKKDGKKFEEETKKREAVKQSLNELLQSFNKGSHVTEEKVKIFHPQPKEKKKPKVTEKEPEVEDPEKEKETKKDGKKFEEETKKREAVKQSLNELLQSFNEGSHVTEEKVKIFHPQPKEKKKPKVTKKEPEVDFFMKKAVKTVAETLRGDTDKTESELMAALRSHSSSQENLSDVLRGMEFKTKKSSAEESYSEDRRKLPRSKLYKFRQDNVGDSAKVRRLKPIVSLNARPLGIFPPTFKPSEEAKESFLPTWDAALEREKRISVSHQPRNYFEEIIKWTEEEKLWQFPIDNEIGLEEEKSCSFADHIFLERHLQGWCPAKGPIRHFMELVCVGLSKNPYITVARKKAHIEWYKNYFDSKKEVLKEVGAL